MSTKYTNAGDTYCDQIKISRKPNKKMTFSHKPAWSSLPSGRRSWSSRSFEKPSSSISYKWLVSEVGIFTTGLDSVPDLLPINNRFSFDHRIKIGCNFVNDNFGQQPIHNRLRICELIHRFKFGCNSVSVNFSTKIINSKKVKEFSVLSLLAVWLKPIWG